MHFQGKLNEAEVKEALRLTRPKGYRWRAVLNNVRLVIYAAIAVAVLWASLVQHARIPPQVLWTRVAILLLLGGFSFYRARKGSRDAVAALDMSLPDTLTLSSEGVRHQGPNGAEGFQPWSAYVDFREGGSVMLLRRREKGLFSVLPISALSSPEREALRSLLRSSLPLTEAAGGRVGIRQS